VLVDFKIYIHVGGWSLYYPTSRQTGMWSKRSGRYKFSNTGWVGLLAGQLLYGKYGDV